MCCSARAFSGSLVSTMRMTLQCANRGQAEPRSALEKFHGMTGKECGEFSHRVSAGWQTVNNHEVIPYETSLVYVRPLTEEEIVTGPRATASLTTLSTLLRSSARPPDHQPSTKGSRVAPVSSTHTVLVCR